MRDIQLYHGDCLEIMPQLPDKCCDMILCDPPYGTTDCKWDSVLPMDKVWEQYNRLLKPQGSVLLFGSEPFSSYLRMSNINAFKYDWIWKKQRPTGFQHAKNMPLKDYEIISVFTNASMGHESLLGDKRQTYNPQGLKEVRRQVHRRSPNNFGGVVGARKSHVTDWVQEFGNYPTMILEFAKEGSNYHPTQKPIALLSYLIKTYTNDRGGVIMDNCMGSGSTGVACVETGRGFIGIEKDAHFYEVAKERIARRQRQGIQGDLFE